MEKYKGLRQNDATGFGSSYRMTVRQLESLIRLSESLARLHCDPEIKVKYVREACRLLKNSIIRIESEDVDLSHFSLMDEPEAPVVVDEDTTMDAETTTTTSNNNDQEQQQQEEEPAAATTTAAEPVEKIRYEDYLRISNMIVYHLRKSDETMVSVRKSQVVSWYLDAIEDELETEADYIRRKKQVQAIIERLIHKVRWSIVLTL